MTKVKSINCVESAVSSRTIKYRNQTDSETSVNLNKCKTQQFDKFSKDFICDHIPTFFKF